MGISIGISMFDLTVYYPGRRFVKFYLITSCDLIITEERNLINPKPYHESIENINIFKDYILQDYSDTWLMLYY